MEEPRFRTSLWGFKKAQVHEYIAQLKREFELKREEFTARNRELASQHEELNARLSALTAELAKYQEQERHIAQILVQAQVRAEAIEQEAREKAEGMKQDLMMEVAIKRRELHNIQARIDQFKQDFTHMLDNYRASLSTLEDLAGGGERLWPGLGVGVEKDSE